MSGVCSIVLENESSRSFVQNEVDVLIEGIVGIALNSLNAALRPRISNVFTGCVSGLVAAVLGASVAVSWSNAGFPQSGYHLQTVRSAEYLLQMFGIPLGSWFTDSVGWLQRPQLAALTYVVSALSAFIVVCWRRHGIEFIWIVLLVASVSLGRSAFIVALGSLIATYIVLIGSAALDHSEDRRQRERTWFLPSSLFARLITDLAQFSLFPAWLLLAMFASARDKATFASANVNDGNRLTIGATSLAAIDRADRD